jgi:hypothetical protein
LGRRLGGILRVDRRSGESSERKHRDDGSRAALDQMNHLDISWWKMARMTEQQIGAVARCPDSIRSWINGS